MVSEDVGTDGERSIEDPIVAVPSLEGQTVGAVGLFDDPDVPGSSRDHHHPPVSYLEPNEKIFPWALLIRTIDLRRRGAPL